MRIKVTFLGTGTSQGIPVIGCECSVCQSNIPQDSRLRTSVLVETPTHTILIDAGPDLRQQLLRANPKKIDAILLTHEHNDHIVGMDEIRPFNFRQKMVMPVYGLKRTLNELKIRFSYAFDDDPYPGAPRLNPIEIGEDMVIPFGKLEVIPIEVLHGNISVLGFRFGPFVYITDAKAISEKSISKIKGADTIVLNALHHQEHHSHFNLDEAIAMGKKLDVPQVYFTHMSHQMGLHHEVENILPPGFSLAYDGMVLEFDVY
jgi:phosphoribosyl 1,2-cyclic phosphate phosphodiesterase